MGAWAGGREEIVNDLSPIPAAHKRKVDTTDCPLPHSCSGAVILAEDDQIVGQARGPGTNLRVCQ